MAAEETQSGVKSFYEDYVPYFVSRIKDIQTSRALKRRRNDQEGVERCDKMIKEVKSNCKAFYESAVENTLESIEQQPGDETVEEGSCYFSSDEDVEKGDENEKRQDGVDFEKRGKVNFVDGMHQNGGKQGLNNDEKAELNIVDDAGRNNADEIKNGNAQLLDAEDRNTGTSQEEKSEKDKEKKVSSRTKKECPLPGCDKTVIHLPRHLREAHKWSPRKAKTAVQKFGLRKTKVEKIGNKKRDYHVMKICPIPGCRSTVRRIADHLTGKHKLKRTSERYKDALKTAMKAPVGEHVFTKLKKERLERKALLRDVFGDEREEALDDSETLLRDEVGDESGEAFDESAETEVTETATEETEDNEIAAEETEATEAEATETEECGDECSDVDDKTPPTTTEMLNSFKIWLLSPDGGKNDMKTATQHMKQLLKVISIIDPAEFQIATLFDYKLIREKFITEYAEPKYYPKTIKSYIMSVRHFYTYVITDEPKEIKVDDKDALMSIRERLKRWSKSYKKQSNRRLWEKREEDVERRVTPDIIVIIVAKIVIIAIIDIIIVIIVAQIVIIAIIDIIIVIIVAQIVIIAIIDIIIVIIVAQIVIIVIIDIIIVIIVAQIVIIAIIDIIIVIIVAQIVVIAIIDIIIVIIVAQIVIIAIIDIIIVIIVAQIIIIVIIDIIIVIIVAQIVIIAIIDIIIVIIVAQIVIIPIIDIIIVIIVVYPAILGSSHFFFLFLLSMSFFNFLSSYLVLLHSIAHLIRYFSLAQSVVDSKKSSSSICICMCAKRLHVVYAFIH